MLLFADATELDQVASNYRGVAAQLADTSRAARLLSASLKLDVGRDPNVRGLVEQVNRTTAHIDGVTQKLTLDSQEAARRAVMVRLDSAKNFVVAKWDAFFPTYEDVVKRIEQLDGVQQLREFSVRFPTVQSFGDYLRRSTTQAIDDAVAGARLVVTDAQAWAAAGARAATEAATAAERAQADVTKYQEQIQRAQDRINGRRPNDWSPAERLRQLEGATRRHQRALERLESANWRRLLNSPAHTVNEALEAASKHLPRAATAVRETTTWLVNQSDRLKPVLRFVTKVVPGLDAVGEGYGTYSRPSRVDTAGMEAATAGGVKLVVSFVPPIAVADTIGVVADLGLDGVELVTGTVNFRVGELSSSIAQLSRVIPVAGVAFDTNDVSRLEDLKTRLRTNVERPGERWTLANYLAAETGELAADGVITTIRAKILVTEIASEAWAVGQQISRGLDTVRRGLEQLERPRFIPRSYAY